MSMCSLLLRAFKLAAHALPFRWGKAPKSMKWLAGFGMRRLTAGREAGGSAFGRVRATGRCAAD